MQSLPHTAEKHFLDFLERHALCGNPILESESQLIYWTSTANISVNEFYRQVKDDDLWRFPAAGFLVNLLHRNLEHAEAAIVAFTTGSGASSEGLSRVATELAVSILYILDSNPQGRLIAFFRHYLDGENKRLEKWAQAAQDFPEHGCREHLQAIEERRKHCLTIGGTLNRLQSEFASADSAFAEEPWPNVAARFKALDDVAGYRTLYARMSSQVHSDAEETIRYFIGKVSDDEKLMERMAVDTFWFSKLMLYLAIEYFLKASAKFCEVYGLHQETVLLEKGLAAIAAELELISRHV
jgi:hypothetical protein